MFNVIDIIPHDFASVYITRILIYRDMSMIYFSSALFSCLKWCFIFATLVRPFSMDVVWIIFNQLLICIAVAGVCWYVQDSCKIGLW